MSEPRRARQLLDKYPDLRRHMRTSAHFQALKDRQALTVDDETLYVVMGDALGEEDELYVDALARGASDQSLDALARSLYEELSDELRAVVRTSVRGR